MIYVHSGRSIPSVYRWDYFHFTRKSTDKAYSEYEKFSCFYRFLSVPMIKSNKKNKIKISKKPR